MRVMISESAKADLSEGYRFYQAQEPGLGSYFLDSLFSDIDSLGIFGGVHAKVMGSHRALSKRFPFAIYYQIHFEEVRVIAVLDCRRRPSWIRKRLKAGENEKDWG